MIIGNQESREQLKTYITQNNISESWKVSFFLLYWPNNIGKASSALALAQEYLWAYVQWWLLHIKDFSEELWKKHTIKIEEKNTTEEYKNLYDTYQYNDIGVREINNWLQQSAFWWSKILLIENIERMTREATNAFLKACEEPLPNRVIIATTSNKAKILDTILSRAVAIPFFPLIDQEMNRYLEEKSIIIDDVKLKELLIMISMGKPWTLESFWNMIKNDEELKGDMHRILKILPESGNIHEKYDILVKYKNQWIVEQFLDGWIAYCSKYYIDQAGKRLKVKKLFQANINKENILLYGLLD